MVTGQHMDYVGGTTCRPIPLATDRFYRHSHAEPKPKARGLNWDALIPRCKGCGQPSGRLGPGELCPTCNPVAPPPPPPAVEPPKRKEPKPSKPKVERIKAPEGEADPAGVGAPPAVENGTYHGVVVTPPEPRPPVPTTLDTEIAHTTQVLTDTAAADHPATRLLRLNALAAVEALYMFHQLNQSAVPATSTPAGTVQTSPELAHTSLGGGERPGGVTSGKTRRRRPPANTRNPPQTRRVFDTAQIVREYTEQGDSAPVIAQRHGCSAFKIRSILDQAGIVRRDDRGTKSGGRRLVDDAEFVEQIRDLYVNQGLTQEQTGERLGCSSKVIYRVISRTPDIEPHPSAAALSAQGIGRSIKIPFEDHPKILDRYLAGESAPHIAKDYQVAAASIYHLLNKYQIPRHGKRTPGTGKNGASNLQASIAALGVTSRQIKDWALAEGLIDRIIRGHPRQAVVDAYAAAHPTTRGDDA